MVKPIKKPSLEIYVKVMLPHILPIRAKETGITSVDKEKWKVLVNKTRKEVKNRYANSSAEELITDMSFKRYSQKCKEKKRALRAAENKGKSSPIYAFKEMYLKTIGELTPQPIITDNYEESNYIIRTLRCGSDSSRQWIANRRLELLQKISKAEQTFAKAISESGYKVIMKMPFVVDKKIYFCNLYMPALHFAIDISDVLCTQVTNDSDKTNDLKYIGVTRLRISKSDAASRKTLETIISNIVK